MKKLTVILLILALAGCLTVPAWAETLYGDGSWTVVFTPEKELETNFGAGSLTDVISGMQPGDTAVLRLAVRNDYGAGTDWYMTNKVLFSLEDRSANSRTGGGAYTYILTYSGPDGTVELFNSDTVGGEGENGAGEGLHQAAGALEDFFYLDSLGRGQSGTITLEVALDGETQGNDYQDTLADLQMNFAVTLRSSDNTDVVQTGDESNMPLYLALAGVSGVLLLLVALYGWAGNRKKRRKGEDDK